jgi:hypothetical protein
MPENEVLRSYSDLMTAELNKFRTSDLHDEKRLHLCRSFYIFRIVKSRRLQRAGVSLGSVRQRMHKKSPIIWDITPCSPLKVKWRFRGKRRFHLQRWRILQARSQFACCLLHAGFLISLFFNLEDEGDMFFRIVGCLSAGYIPGGMYQDLFITI